MKLPVIAFALLIVACNRVQSTTESVVLLNAPPQLDGARVYVDDQFVGNLKTTHSYRRGEFASQNEWGAPPRYEANLEIAPVAQGSHRLRIAKPGFTDYLATFKNHAAHVEIFIRDEAAKRSAAN